MPTKGGEWGRGGRGRKYKRDEREKVAKDREWKQTIGLRRQRTGKGSKQ
jgi:hypothetical protein